MIYRSSEHRGGDGELYKTGDHNCIAQAMPAAAMPIIAFVSFFFEAQSITT